MAIALSIFGAVFAAFCIWLTVRIVNRRERWAKWKVTLAAVVGLPVLYVASFGPACSWADHHRTRKQVLKHFYRPLARTAWMNPTCLALLTEYGQQWPGAGWNSEYIIICSSPDFEFD
jgi:hypothetical protein